MEFDNTLEVPLPPAEAWTLLLDVERIAACIPGAELTEVVDERTYKGKVAVRIGPVALSLVGQARLEEIDAAGRQVSMKAQGSDPKGRGSTEAMIRFHLEPAGTGTRVVIHSDVKLVGAIAQYGRGSGMIQSVASQLIGQFGDNLKARIGRGSADAPGAAKPISGLTVLGKAVLDQMGQAAKKPKA
jgi:carbon monoxide dehydrogenase subunit G